MDKKRRLVFQLDTPYSAVTWPEVSLGDQETILELLCNLLAPLGRYRSEQAHPSKGKRGKKRKRKEPPEHNTDVPAPPAPELSSHIDVGLTAVTRCLQKTSSDGQPTQPAMEGQASEDGSAGRFYSVIFVARSGQPNALNNHLPQMVAVASKAHPSRKPIRLVGLSKACEDRLSESLGIPRVSCIGLCEGAPNSMPLVDFVRQHVPIIEIAWLEEAKRADYRDTKIATIETTIGPRKQLTHG